MNYTKIVKTNWIFLILLFLLITSFYSIHIVAAEKPTIDPEVTKLFEENQTLAEVMVRFVGGIPVNDSNKQEMISYYRNTTVIKSFFSYIEDADMRITKSTLIGSYPTFVAVINLQGFEKLSNDPRVVKIDLEKQAYLANNLSNKNNTSIKNETLSPEPIQTMSKMDQTTLFLFLSFIILIIFVFIMYIKIKRRKK